MEPGADVPCASPYLQDFALLFYAMHCASAHEALTWYHQGCVSKLQKGAGVLAIWLEELRHRPKVEGCLHGEQVLLTSFGDNTHCENLSSP